MCLVFRWEGFLSGVSSSLCFAFVVGVNVFEVVLAHAVTQQFIIAVQMGLMVFVLLVVFQVSASYL